MGQLTRAMSATLEVQDGAAFGDRRRISCHGDVLLDPLAGKPGGLVGAGLGHPDPLGQRAARSVCSRGIQPPSSVNSRRQPAAGASAIAILFSALPRHVDTCELRHLPQPSVRRLGSREAEGKARERSSVDRSPPRSALAPSVAFGPGLRRRPQGQLENHTTRFRAARVSAAIAAEIHAHESADRNGTRNADSRTVEHQPRASTTQRSSSAHRTACWTPPALSLRGARARGGRLRWGVLLRGAAFAFARTLLFGARSVLGGRPRGSFTVWGAAWLGLAPRRA